MCTPILKKTICYIYHIIPNYATQGEGNPPMCYQRGPGEKKSRGWKNSFFQKQGYDVTLRFSQLIIYKGRKRYIVTWDWKSSLADRFGPAKPSNSKKGVCDRALFLLPGAVKTSFVYQNVSKMSAPHRGWSNIHDILVIQWPQNYCLAQSKRYVYINWPQKRAPHRGKSLIHAVSI